jgi:hypothetical protein
MKGCAIRRSRDIAVLNVSSLVLNLPWPSDHVCNGGIWKIPARPGEASSEARSARRSFPKEFIPDFSREILEKNPGILEKNPVELCVVSPGAGVIGSCVIAGS